MKDSQGDSGLWCLNSQDGAYRAGQAASVPDILDFAVDGLVPETGVSMWFGPGSTGKTQLLLWLAAHLAARDGTGPDEWLGAPIRKRGHVLVLSAEDIREHILVRIGGIARAMKAEFPAVDCVDLCDRIHVIPFLSLSEEEFGGRSPSLYEGRRNRWRASSTLLSIEQFIDSWNADHVGDEQIVGVIMDSAVSMSGFELSDSEATTEFLFRVNRVSNRQRVFWAIVGHTPKGAEIKDDDPLDGAADRLRGSAMWSTTPRTVVELRIAGETEELADIQRAFPNIGRRDIVVANVVKSNSKHADFKPRVLRRLSEGAFQDITSEFPDVCKSWDPTVPAPSPLANVEDRKEALIALIRNITHGGRPGATFSRDALEAEFRKNASKFPALAGVIGDAARAHEKNKRSLSYLLLTLKKEESIKVQRNGPVKILNLDAEEPPMPAEAA
jgi:hypothetical protein